MRGKIRVRLTGHLSRGMWEKLSNLGELENVRLTETGAEMTLRAEKLRELRRLLRGQGISVKIVKRYGILRIRKGFRLRPVLVPALCIAVLLLWGVTRTVLFVDIEGAKDEIQEAELLMQLATMGIEKGVWKDAVDVTAASEEILRTTPGITYAGLSRTGAGLTLKIVQAKEKPAVFDENEPVDVVAVCGGIVNKVVTLTGEALVKPGDTVIPGQILIRGDTLCAHASGEVTADVWVQGKGEAEQHETTYVVSGRECVTKALEIGKRTLLKIGKSDFADEIAEESAVSICPNLFVPIRVTEMRHREKTDSLVPRKLSLIKAESAAKALENAMKSLPTGACVVDKRTEYSMIEKGKLACLLNLHCVAQIGQEKPR